MKTKIIGSILLNMIWKWKFNLLCYLARGGIYLVSFESNSTVLFLGLVSNGTVAAVSSGKWPIS